MICFAFFVLKAGDEMFLFFYFPMQRERLMKTCVVQREQVKQGSVSEYLIGCERMKDGKF